MNRTSRHSVCVRALGFVAICLFLSSCAAPRMRADKTRMQGLELRERNVLAKPDWSLQGRMAISGPEDSGSGSLVWTQGGTAYRFALSAPVSGKTWTLSGDTGRAELTGLHEQAVVGTSASELLVRELGWQVPVTQLSYWVRGIRAPGHAEVVFREDGLPAEFRQDGWLIEFRDYEPSGDPILPRKIFAERGDYRVRLVVRVWGSS